MYPHIWYTGDGKARMVGTIMKIDGRRSHLGERPRSGGVPYAPAPLVARPAPDASLEVVWYPHKDAPSLLPDDLATHANHLLSRGAIALRSRPQAVWSWLG